MTPHQEYKIHQLEDTVKVPRGTLPDKGNYKRYLFTEVSGVTVIITLRSTNPDGNGGFIVPSLHTYPETVKPTNLHAAANARRYYDDQTCKLGGGKYTFDFGHRGPIVNHTDLKCGEDCPCKYETPERREERSIGHVVKSVA